MDVVLITGANKGIGFEVARQLAGKGMQVLLGSRVPSRGQDAVNQLHSEGLSNTEFIELDVTKETSIAKAVALVQSRFGVLDVLINNAGIAADRQLPSEATQGNLRYTFDTNFFAAVAVTQAFLPLLHASANGRIINVSSGLGSLTLHSDPNWQYGHINVLSYCASKSALNAFSVLLAKELRDSSIKVNVADPGYTATDLNNNSGTQTVAEGSEAIVTLATAPADGPSGTYIDRAGAVPW
jgi:NAD(P)-dependent dehydrogenase (short-subunit alcohol dehydrogenase family)